MASRSLEHDAGTLNNSSASLAERPCLRKNLRLIKVYFVMRLPAEKVRPPSGGKECFLSPRWLDSMDGR